MITVDWPTVMLGGAVGFAMGTVFFVGLAIGIRLALQSESPVKILSLSAVLRIAALLGVGWIVQGQGGPWAVAGYAFAVFVVRLIATTYARVSAPVGRAP
ncbi:MAG: ATP synthase subunit AtpR [Yoonia sp.]|nr:ATP synthase subunit AtpR [Yoonia sp.]